MSHNKAVSKFVGGMVEAVLRFQMVTYFLLNEEGKLMGLPLNPRS